MPRLLELPTDLLRLILSRSPLSHITARFLCRRFRDLLPPLSYETRQQAREFCKLAASNGYLNLIKWARANCCPWDEETCYYAAQGGHLQVLQWLRTNGCPWDSGTCTCAASGGHLVVLKWARDNGCPYNAFSCLCSAKTSFMEAVVEGEGDWQGLSDVLEWLRANG